MSFMSFRRAEFMVPCIYCKKGLIGVSGGWKNGKRSFLDTAQSWHWSDRARRAVQSVPTLCPPWGCHGHYNRK